MLDEKGRVKRTAEVVKTLDENTYEVKSGHKVSKIGWKKLFRVPKVRLSYQVDKCTCEYIDGMLDMYVGDRSRLRGRKAKRLAKGNT
eukprot:1353751-Amorphochlora_amoeboformis.AAC.1